MQKTPCSQQLKESAKLILLLHVGFIKLGEWNTQNGDFDFRESSDPEAKALLRSKPALYAHVVDKKVMYVGKTTQQLGRRIYGYRKPGKRMATNNKCNKHMQNAENKGCCVETFGWQPTDQLYYNEFRINLPAGLEDAIIENLNPKWNGGRTETLANEAFVERTDTLRETSEGPCTGTFSIKLGKVYWKTGFMNPGIGVSNLFGKHGEPIVIQLGWNGTTVIKKINRIANTNGSPRIYGGKPVSDWWQRHFKFEDTVQACILNPNHIVLLLPSESMEPSESGSTPSSDI